MLLAIRRAKHEDYEAVMAIYANARFRMAEDGNPDQWGNDWPTEKLIREDIKRGSLFVCVPNNDSENSNAILGVFAAFCGPDPTYMVIDGGEWLNKEPYMVIHRIAAAPNAHGVLKTAVKFCLKQDIDSPDLACPLTCSTEQNSNSKPQKHFYQNIRIDTHKNNLPMRHALTKLGFVRTGIIYVRNHEPREAYQLAI